MLPLHRALAPMDAQRAQAVAPGQRPAWLSRLGARCLGCVVLFVAASGASQAACPANPADCVTEVQNLVTSLVSAQATISQLNTQLSATTQSNATSINSLRTQLTAANNKVIALSSILTIKDQTITSLSQQVSDLNGALENAQRKADADIASWTQMFSRAETDRLVCVASLDAATTRINTAISNGCSIP